MDRYDEVASQVRLNAAIEAEYMNLVALLKPRIFIDGDKWCVLYGSSLQEGVCGFGDSPLNAVFAFNRAWHEKLKGASDV